jgi:hypothetical protein
MDVALPADHPAAGRLAGTSWSAGRHAVAFASQQGPAGTPYLLAYDLDAKAFRGAGATLPGVPSDAFAATDASALTVLVQVYAQTGTASWPLFGRLDLASGAWTLEEAPPRWAGLVAEGLVATDGGLVALLHGPTGRTLWALAGGSWTPVPLAGSSPLNLFALGGNGSAAVAVGKDAGGATQAWTYDPRSGQAAASPLADATLPLDAGRYAVAGAGGGPPFVAFSRSSEGVVRVAVPDGPAWRVDEPGLAGVPLAAASSAGRGYLLLQESATTAQHLFAGSGAAWAECPLRPQGPAAFAWGTGGAALVQASPGELHLLDLRECATA